MSKEKETPTITMTEEQLERVIKLAVKQALYEMKNEEKELPGLKEDELASAATTFNLLKFVLAVLFGGLGFTSALIVINAFSQMIQNGFQWQLGMTLFDFGGFVIISIVAIVEIVKIKKIEVFNSIFTALMALSTLIVAIASAVFAYKAL